MRSLVKAILNFLMFTISKTFFDHLYNYFKITYVLLQSNFIKS